MTTGKTIGILLIAGVTGVFVPYTVLTITFQYPDILRQDAGTVLTRFHAGGSPLILTWWAFAILGLPLLSAYTLIGQRFAAAVPYVRTATTVGVIGLVVQMTGLLRWTFVVPLLASHYVTGNAMAREASLVGFQIVHQYGGVVLGEHLGQLFTVIWTIMMSLAFARLRIFPRWLTGLGLLASAIYLLAQAELFATVIPAFPVWEPAGFIGSTLWLIWLLALGILFLKAPEA